MLDFISTLTGFEQILFYIAVPFSLLTGIQLVLQFIGGGHDLDAVAADLVSPDIGHAHLPDFAVFTLSNFIYFLTLFGWAGIAASKAGASLALSLTIATLAGVLTTLLIAYIFSVLNRLTESGNIKIANAVGALGVVYLPIPPKRGGSGIVQVTIQGATVEVNAMTDGAELKTGQSVQVQAMLDGNTLLVDPLR